MKITVAPDRSTGLLRYRDPDGKGWVRFIEASNTSYTIELPDGSILLDYWTGEPMEEQPAKESL